MDAVTHRIKCYVFVCLGCGMLAHSARSDAVTCSPACRVRVHRNGTAKSERAVWQRHDLPLSIVQQVKAVRELAPELMPALERGEMALDNEARTLIWRRYWARLALAIAERKE